MSGVAAFLKYDRKRFVDAADYLAIALVASLPWSTSMTYILTGAWVMVLLPTLDWRTLREEIATASGGLPVLLVTLAALGTLWAEAAWNERTAGLVSHLRLLVIPLLFIQFRRSERGLYAIYMLLASCVALLAASYLSIVLPGRFPDKGAGVVVKDYISQSGFFTICVFLLAEMAVLYWRERRRAFAVGCVLIGAAFLANIVYVTTGRTALLVIPVLMVLFGLRRNWKMALVSVLACVILAAAAWSSSAYLRHRVAESFSLRNTVGAVGDPSSTGLRLAFWKASFDIATQAPLFGHGTGSIRTMFKSYSATHKDSYVEEATNPHQQTLAVAVQLGLVGVALLLGMWLAHGLMFRGPGIVAWFGYVIVVQNVVGSLANSHLYDFTQGWTYAVCVGIAGGMMRKRDAVPAVSPQDRAPQ